MHTYANAPELARHYFWKLRDVRYKIKEDNMRNMGERGFILGTVNCVKVIARAVIECCGARLKYWLSSRVPPYSIQRFPKMPRSLAHSPKGYSTSDIGLEWLRNNTAPTFSRCHRSRICLGQQDHPYFMSSPLNSPSATRRLAHRGQHLLARKLGD